MTSVIVIKRRVDTNFSNGTFQLDAPALRWLPLDANSGGIYSMPAIGCCVWQPLAPPDSQLHLPKNLE